jgi:hypothetical protein
MSLDFAHRARRGAIALFCAVSLWACDPWPDDPEPEATPPPATRYGSQSAPAGDRYVFLNWDVRVNQVAGLVQAAYYRIETIGLDGRFLATDITASSASASQDGKRIVLAYTGRESGVTANGGTFVPRLAVMASDFSGLTVYPVKAETPAFIPGQDAACYEREGRLYRYDFPSRAESSLPPPQPASDKLRFPRYSPDGKLLAYIQEHGEWWLGYAFIEYTNKIFVQDVQSGAVRQLPVPECAVNYLAWSRDSAALYYHTQVVSIVNSNNNPTDFSIFRISLEEGAAPERLTDPSNANQGSCGFPVALPDGKLLAVSDGKQRAGFTGEGDYRYDTIHDLATLDPLTRDIATVFQADTVYPGDWQDSCGELAWPMFLKE